MDGQADEEPLPLKHKKAPTKLSELKNSPHKVRKEVSD